MFARLKRTVLSFLVVVAAFCIYRVAAVPIMEPHPNIKRVASAPRESHDPKQSQSHLGGYARFFPEGSWELDNPIIMNGANAKYLVKEYKITPDHRVILNPLTMIYLPDGDAETADSRHRVIILQAPHGAELQFDDQEDLDHGKMGHLLGGVMNGPVTIQSGPTRPDGGDDMLIVTHDVQMKDNLIFTPNEVDFRFGASYGHGRDMRMELLRSQSADSGHGTNFSGVQSFQLLTDVQMHLQPGSSGFLPGDQTASAVRTANLSAPNGQPTTTLSAASANNPPVDIRCQGPFDFDLVENIATFHDQVDVVRPHPNGPSDQMNCELLNLYFGPREQHPGSGQSSIAASSSLPPAGTQQAQKNTNSHGMSQLEPKRLVARGNPVVVRGQSMAGEIRGQRLEYEIASRHLVVDAADKTVEIESPQLSGAVSRLEAWLQDQSTSDPTSTNAGQMERHQLGGDANNPLNLNGDNNSTSHRRYEIYGGILKVWSVNHASQNEVERVTVEGNVQFAQSASQSGEKPLEARGDYLEVLRANSPDAEVTITGRPAEINAQGLTMCGQNIHLNRGQNRLWIEGPGRMIVTNLQLQQNNPSATATAGDGLLASNHGPTTVDWQQGMVFDGQTARFMGDVVGQRADKEISQIIRAPQLDALMHQRVDFNTANPQQQQRSQIEWLTCSGGVTLENRQQQQGELVAVDVMQHLSTLSVNQLTGELSGQAAEDQPGRLFSWRIGSSNALAAGFGALPGTAATHPATADAANHRRTGDPNITGVASVNSTDAAHKQINYLDVQFQRGITGNVLRRELVFHEQVRSVYGPVSSWNAQLDPDSTAGLPPGSLLLTCDQLAMNQTPAIQGRSTMELQATGNTRIDGQQQEGDAFTALAQQLNYSEAKGLLVLAGDGRNDAQLFRQLKPGAPQTKTAAGSIYYWPATRQVKMGDLKFVDSTQFSSNPVPHTAAPAIPSAAQQPASPPRR